MNRRHFLLSAMSTPLFAQSANNTPQREYYELRTFHLRNGNHSPRMFELLQQWTTAAGRIGQGAVGVFQPVIGEDSPSVLMVSVFANPEAATGSFDRLMDDKEFATAYRKANSPEPAFTRMESSLYRAFSGFPALKRPQGRDGGATHLFELRTYESNSMISLRTKIEMFNSGEIAIFERLGMKPVFFGESMFGNRQPCLTYMLAYDDLEARDRVWKAFVSDPEWTKMKGKPGYSDAEIVSNISNSILRPLAFSGVR